MSKHNDKRKKVSDIASAAKERAKKLEARTVSQIKGDPPIVDIGEDPLVIAAQERSLGERLSAGFGDALEAAALSAQAASRLPAEGGIAAAGVLGALTGTTKARGKRRGRKREAAATEFERLLKTGELDVKKTTARAAGKQADVAEQNSLTRQFEAQTGSFKTSLDALDTALKGEQILLTDEEKRFAGAREATANLIGALEAGVQIKPRPGNRAARQKLEADGFTEMILIGTSGRNAQSFFVKPASKGGGGKDNLRVLRKQLEQGFELATQGGNEESKIRGEQLMESAIKGIIAEGVPAVPIEATKEQPGLGSRFVSGIKNIFRPAATGTLGGDTAMVVGEVPQIPQEDAGIEALRAKGANDRDLANIKRLRDAGLVEEAARLQVAVDDRLNRGIR